MFPVVHRDCRDKTLQNQAREKTEASAPQKNEQDPQQFAPASHKARRDGTPVLKIDNVIVFCIKINHDWSSTVASIVVQLGCTLADMRSRCEICAL